MCVPLSHLAELISRSKQELDSSPLTWYVLYAYNYWTQCIGHYEPLRIRVCTIYNAHCLSFFNSTVIAHAGDGNFHVVVLFDPTKEEQRREAERLNHFMVHIALSMEGTRCIFLGLSDPLFSSTISIQHLVKEEGNIKRKDLV